MWLYSEIKSLGDVPRHYARMLPGKPAIIDAAGPMSFADLDVRSNRIANVLNGLTLGRGARVAFLGKNSRWYFEVLFGVSKAGAAFLPLNWRLAVPELASIMRDASPAAIVFDREYADTARIIAEHGAEHCRLISYDSERAGSCELDELMNAAEATDSVIAADPWQTAVLMYTSGTNGRPKGVQLPHQGYLYPEVVRASGAVVPLPIERHHALRFAAVSCHGIRAVAAGSLQWRGDQFLAQSSV